jgi:hypothetical protein
MVEYSNDSNLQILLKTKIIKASFHKIVSKMENTVLKAVQKIPSRIFDEFSLFDKQNIELVCFGSRHHKFKNLISITGKVLKSTTTFADMYVD